MRKAIFEILEEANDLKNEKDRIEYLQQFADNTVLRDVLAGTFHHGVTWLLPPGKPPFKPQDPVNAEGFLYHQARKFYLFADGQAPNLTSVRRETLFIEMLESVHPKDAEILICMKDKKPPYKAITRTLIQKAFPGLLNETN